MSTAEVVPETPANGADTPHSGAQGHADYEARVRSDPEFALAEIKRNSASANKLNHELKTLAPLKDIVSRLDGGAATAAQLIYEQAALLQHPQVRSVVEHYRKFGTLPTSPVAGSDASEDEYKDPVDVLRHEVTELREQLQMVNGHVQRDRTVIAQTATQSNLQKIADEFGDDWEVIKPHVIAKAEEWEQTPNGREILASSTPATWRNLANLVRGEHMDEVLSKRAEKRSQIQSGLGTEPRSNTVTTGREDPIRREEVWRPGQARKLIEDIRRREGRSV